MYAFKPSESIISRADRISKNGALPLRGKPEVIHWWLNVSSLQKRYASVDNDYTGTPGGYCGFQTLGDGSRVFIMSEWSTFCKDHSGNVTVFTPEVIYPEGKGKGKGNTDSSEGTFTQCIVPYDWSAGRDYRVLLHQSGIRRTFTSGPQGSQ